MLQDYAALGAKQKRNLFLSLAAILIIYVGVTSYFGGIMHESKSHSVESHAERMDPSVVSATYPEGDYVPVTIGMYIEALRNVSIVDSTFEAVFYLWFSWEGDADFSPGDTLQMVGGEIEEKVLVSEHYDDGQNYQRYKVTASFDKFYSLTRVSLEDHMLNIYIEDTTRDGAKLRYVADTEETNISSRVNVPGFEQMGEMQSVVKPHSYKSTYSSPSAAGSDERVFSQYIVGLEIVRDGYGFFLKVLIPFVLSVALALSALFSHRTESDSLGLSGAAFFGVIANAYVVQTMVPFNGGEFGLLDMLNVVSLFTVLLVVAISIISLTLRQQQENVAFCRSLDRGAFFAVSFGYLLFLVVVPMLASSV